MYTIIFLDIDGVLATDSSSQADKSLWFNEFAYPFDKQCVEYLNSLLEKTDADIILTSDWRKIYDLQEMDEIFRFNGLRKSPLDFTPDLGNRVREIELFLSKHELGKYCVIDDMDLSELGSCFVRCEATFGIGQREVAKIFDLLQ